MSLYILKLLDIIKIIDIINTIIDTFFPLLTYFLDTLYAFSS